MKDQKTVAILTTFQDFNPGYSLTGIVIEQAYMLARAGHKVVIIVNENFNPKHNASLDDLFMTFPEQIVLEKKCKHIHLTDYVNNKMSEEHQKEAKEAGEMFADTFIEHQVDVALTHDYIFTGWNLPYYHALIHANRILREKQENCQWYHWIHSVPSGHKEWWDLAPFGFNHFLVFPNKTEIQRVAEAWRVPPARVKIIPHVKDIRNWYDFGEDSRELLDRYPAIMASHCCQVYPCSTDRLSAKQLDIVIKIFGYFKSEANMPVFLVIANQWATGRQRKEDVDKYCDLAASCGLEYGQDYIFTSKEAERWETGISKRMLRELQLLSTLFVFPTMEESFGLVGPEAAYSGCLPVINRSLPMMGEVMSVNPPAFEFGSFCNQCPDKERPEYLNAVARAILNRVFSQESVVTKTFCRVNYNMDNIYQRYYLPIL